MDLLFYTNADLTEKSAVPLGVGLPELYFELLELDLVSLKNDYGLTIYDIEWTHEGIITDLGQAKIDKENKKRKSQHEAAAYAQQDSFFTPNKRHLFDGVVYNAPPADMDLLPKMNKYRVFMKALWTEYHTRIANGSTDYDYSEFAPETEYSYVELEQEWADYNQVS